MRAALRRCAVALPLLLLSACTALPTFSFDDPEAEISLVGRLGSGTGGGGGAVFWGQARNTGDFDLVEVAMVVDLYGGGGAFLGSFRGPVSKGLGKGGEDPDTSLAVGESGSFVVETTVPLGAVARVDHHAEWVQVEEEEGQ